MASDGITGAITGINPVIGIQTSPGKALPPSGKSADAATAASIPAGKVLPQSGKGATIVAASSPAVSISAATPAANDTTAFKGRTVAGAGSSSSAAGTAVKSTAVKPATVSRSEPQTLVDQVNKYLNDSGRPDEFRVDPSSASYIQQVNPSTGAVIAEYSVSEFPALARSVGASGLLIDDTA